MEGLRNAGGLHKSVDKPRTIGEASYASKKIDLYCLLENKTRSEP